MASSPAPQRVAGRDGDKDRPTQTTPPWNQSRMSPMRQTWSSGQARKQRAKGQPLTAPTAHPANRRRGSDART